MSKKIHRMDESDGHLCINCDFAERLPLLEGEFSYPIACMHPDNIRWSLELDYVKGFTTEHETPIRSIGEINYNGKCPWYEDRETKACRKKRLREKICFIIFSLISMASIIWYLTIHGCP